MIKFSQKLIKLNIEYFRPSAKKAVIKEGLPDEDLRPSTKKSMIDEALAD